MQHDFITTDHYYCYVCSRNYADTFSAICSLQFQTSNAAYIQYLGKVLPGAIFSMLVVYCLRHVSLLQGSHGLPELIAILLTVGLHLWKRQMLLSIAGGTVCYMLLIQFIF